MLVLDFFSSIACFFFHICSPIIYRKPQKKENTRRDSFFVGPTIICVLKSGNKDNSCTEKKDMLVLRLNAAAAAFFNADTAAEFRAEIVYAASSSAPKELRFLPHTEPILTKHKDLFICRVENGMCIKLQKAPKELDTLLAMPHSVRTAFVPLLCGFRFRHMDEEWSGMCMPMLDHTLFHIMSISNRVSAAVDIDRLATRFMAASLSPIQQHTHGMPLLHNTPHKQSFEVALLTACCRLLLQLHQNGWVHGDTHLGNFLLCTRTWRVFLIDAERTFPSSDPVQYLMDVQELIGHATGLIVSLFDKQGWDMGDVWGVAAKMHPTNSKHGCSLQNLLPVCTCFVQEETSARERGCCMCRSPLNEAQAALYMRENTAWLLETNDRTYADFLYRIHECRLACRIEIQEFLSRLTPSLALLRRFLHQDMEKKPHYATFHRIFSQDHATMELWLKYACYHGAIVRAGAKKARRLAHIFRRAGLHGLALCLGELTMTCLITPQQQPKGSKQKKTLKKKPSFSFISASTTFPLHKTSSILLRSGSSTLSE